MVTVTNVGSSPLTISGIVASSDFAETDNCSKASLQPGTNCVVNVTYTATTSGPSLGALTITDNVPGSPQVVLLNGTGMVPISRSHRNRRTSRVLQARRLV